MLLLRDDRLRGDARFAGVASGQQASNGRTSRPVLRVRAAGFGRESAGIETWALDSTIFRRVSTGWRLWWPLPEARVAWSPNGALLAFTCIDGEQLGICVAAPDGTNQRQILDDATDPLWAPDGSRLAFLRNHRILWLSSPDGQNQERIARKPAGMLLDSHVSSPDGTTVGMAGKVLGGDLGSVLYLVWIATGRTEQITLSTSVGALAGSPTWRAQALPAG